MILNRTPIYISNDHRLIVIFLCISAALFVPGFSRELTNASKITVTLWNSERIIYASFLLEHEHIQSHISIWRMSVLWAKNWNVSSKLSACQCIQSLLRSWAASNSCLPLKSVRVVVNVITDKNRTSCLRW